MVTSEFNTEVKGPPDMLFSAIDEAEGPTTENPNVFSEEFDDTNTSSNYFWCKRSKQKLCQKSAELRHHSSDDLIDYREFLHHVVSQLYLNIQDSGGFPYLEETDSKASQAEALGVKLRKALVHYQITQGEMFSKEWENVESFVHDDDHEVNLELIEAFVGHFWKAARKWSVNQNNFLVDQLGPNFLNFSKEMK